MVTILMSCSLAELDQVGHARHGAVVVHDLADDAGGLEPGQAREVHRALGLARAPQHAALARAQRENVARPHEVPGLASSAMAASIVVARSCAEMPVVTPSRASIETVKAVPKPGRVLVVGHHHPEVELVELLFGEGEADQPRPYLAMKLMISGWSSRRRCRGRPRSRGPRRPRGSPSCRRGCPRRPLRPKRARAVAVPPAPGAGHVGGGIHWRIRPPRTDPVSPGFRRARGFP